ncbi:hypothetical protein RJT34_26561 [Clitoria ternatea]|uniref:Pectinesterase inhibitor domain-containing protein n=1 Tax=Clitoria ternatea TaxID=43366 RepID=A0AAN9FFP2_CLITE
MANNFSCIVLMFLLLVSSSYAIPNSQVNVICGQTKNPLFCSTLLNSQPNADLKTLTQYTLNVARANITNTIKLINVLIAENANKPDAKTHYSSCLDHFDEDEGALGDLEYTEELFKNGDYQGVGVSASSIEDDVEDCISGESPSDPPYHDTSTLPQYASVVELVAQIIIILSKNLGH